MDVPIALLCVQKPSAYVQVLSKALAGDVLLWGGLLHAAKRLPCPLMERQSRLD